MRLYLLEENGTKIYLEDLSGFLLLEEVTIPPATINYQEGGAGHPVRRKRDRHKTQELFDHLEHTLQELLGLVPPTVEVALQPTEATVAEVRIDRSSAIQETLTRLAAVARGYEGLETRLERLREGLASYLTEQALLDDEESWFLML